MCSVFIIVMRTNFHAHLSSVAGPSHFRMPQDGYLFWPQLNCQIAGLTLATGHITFVFPAKKKSRIVF